MFLFILLSCFLHSHSFLHSSLFNLNRRSSPALYLNTIISPNIISVDDLYSDSWMLEGIINTLKNGGIGVIPTDTCYSFVTRIDSKEGIDRLVKLKGIEIAKKPLNLLCKDFSMISKYTSNLSNQKWVFKMFQSIFPGPYTLIMPSSGEVPKMVVEVKKHVKRWKKKEVGIRIPSDEICQAILKEMDCPLVCGSVPEAAEDIIGILSHSHGSDSIDSDSSGDESRMDGAKTSKKKKNKNKLSVAQFDDESTDIDDLVIFNEDTDYMNNLAVCAWVNKVDFIVENGRRGGSVSGDLSTVIDISSGQPVMLRQGKGELDISAFAPMDL